MVFFEAYCNNARGFFNAAVELNNERLSKATSEQGANKDYLVAVRNDVFKRTKESFKKYVSSVKMLRKSYKNLLRSIPKHGQDLLAAKLVRGKTLEEQTASLQGRFDEQLGKLFKDYTKDLASHASMWSP